MVHPGVPRLERRLTPACAFPATNDRMPLEERLKRDGDARSDDAGVPRFYAADSRASSRQSNAISWQAASTRRSRCFVDVGHVTMVP